MKKNCGGCGGAKCCWILVIIGALNWGLVGIGNFAGGDWDVVQLIFGSIEWLRDVIYVLVGLSGLWLLVGCKCKVCMVKKGDKGGDNQGGGNEGGEGN